MLTPSQKDVHNYDNSIFVKNSVSWCLFLFCGVLGFSYGLFVYVQVIATKGYSFASFIIPWKVLNITCTHFGNKNRVVACQESWYAHLFNNRCLLCSLHQQILLREGCKKILVADSLSLLKKMHRTQMKGVLVDGGYRGNMMSSNILKTILYRLFIFLLTVCFGRCPKAHISYLICRV